MNIRALQKILTVSLLSAVLSIASICSASADGPGLVRSGHLSACKTCAEDPACQIVGDTHMLEWRSGTPSKTIVVCIHGLGLCAKAYKPLAEQLSAAGIDGFGVNVRGFGPDRDQPTRAKLDCVRTVEDVNKLLESIRNEKPGYKVLLIGESMGGALVLRIAAEHPDLVDGVVCSAPAWKILKVRRTAAKGALELVLFPHAEPGPAGRAVIRQATSDPALTEHWLDDPSHKLKLSFKEATAFMAFTSKADSYAKQVRKPILVIQGLEDKLVSPKGVAKLFRDLTATNKTLLIDATGEHLVLEEGRFNDALVQKLISWIRSVPYQPSDAIDQQRIEVINDEQLNDRDRKRLSELKDVAGNTESPKG